MAKGTEKLPNFSTIKEYHVEQVLMHFKIDIGTDNKCLCPFHHETTPSMQVHKHFVYCFGCNQHWDLFGLARKLLEKKQGREITVGEVFAWFKDTTFPARTERKYSRRHEYIGPVAPALVEYWQNCLTEERYLQLFSERLITKHTAKNHRLGWRPDWEAWSIPFYRGTLGQSEVDVVQFRMTHSDKKYLGLAGHSRGTIMNADFLAVPQPLLVVLLGSFDAILARQDGLCAVGLNGSFPFKTTEKKRVQDLFAKQKNVIIVPDVNPQEVIMAYKMADWIGAQVRTFPANFPHNTDYTDYRKSGKTPVDFVEEVLGVGDGELLENLKSLWQHGDPLRLCGTHITLSSALPPDILAVKIAEMGPFFPFTEETWEPLRVSLLEVREEKQLLLVTQDISSVAQHLLAGGW